MTAVLALTDVRVAYERTLALDDLTLRVDAPCVLGVVGPNGSGKSTLIKTIAGIVRATSGEIVVLGNEPGHAPRGAIGYVPQLDSVDWNFPATVDDVVAMGRYPHVRPWQRFSANDRATVRAAIAHLGLAELAKRPIADLSGGQRQRAFVARAIAQEPRLLLLDEPTTGIDAESSAMLRALVRDLARRGVMVVMTSHELDDAEEWFDRIVVVDRRITADGTPRELRERGIYAGLRAPMVRR